jgi:ribosomal protein S2
MCADEQKIIITIAKTVELLTQALSLLSQVIEDSSPSTSTVVTRKKAAKKELQSVIKKHFG